MNTRKSWIMTLVFAIVALIGIGTKTGTAQQTATTADSLQKYTVASGTTMWDLAKKMYGNAEVWHDMFRVNVGANLLTLSDSFQRNGKTVVDLDIGQEILLNRTAAARAPDVVRSVQQTSITPPVLPKADSERTSSLPLVLLLIAAIVILIFFLIRALDRRATMETELKTSRDAETERRKERDQLSEAQTRRQTRPAEHMDIAAVRGIALFSTRRQDEGPSFLAGGIRTPDDLALALQRSAQIADIQRNPEAPTRPHTSYRFRNGVRGRVVSGHYRSLFADGTYRERLIERSKPETHQIVWRAQVAPSEGNEGGEYVYTEEVCANGMGIPIGDHTNMEWIAFPANEQVINLPRSAMYVPPAPPAPTRVETPVTTEQVAVFRTITGEEIRVPTGSTLLGTTDEPVGQSTQRSRRRTDSLGEVAGQ